nr:hypothetical protein [uncultured Pedobacter sp.]
MSEDIYDKLAEISDIEQNQLDSDSEHKIREALKSFDEWLIGQGIKDTKFDLDHIVIEPFSNDDWIMKVAKMEAGETVSFNPNLYRSSSYDFFEVVILHEFFHLVVQKVPNKDDATMIKDYFGSDFMSLIDIEADFYVAYYLKTKGYDLRKYWELYFNGTSIFSDKWIRNKKFERFIGSVLTINMLFSNNENNFDLYLPSVSPIYTEENMKMLVIKEKHICFEEIIAEYKDFVMIKDLYKNPSDLTFEGYFKKIISFTEKALKIKLNIN